jgi:hypothetical protein
MGSESGVRGDVDRVGGEAALLVVEADVPGGESGRLKGIANDETDAEALSVGDEPDVGRDTAAEPIDGVIVPVDNDDSGGAIPVVGQLAGDRQRVAELGWEHRQGVFECRQSPAGEFDVVGGTDEESAQETLKGRVRRVAADDVEDAFRRAGDPEAGTMRSRGVERIDGTEFENEELLETATVEGTGVGLEGR